jgi:cell division protein FtsL
MQAAPKLVGQVPYFSANPQHITHPSRQPLPRVSVNKTASVKICGFALTAACVLAPLAMLHVATRVLVAENGYRLLHIQAEIDGQSKLSEAIKLENTKLSSLERVKKLATEKLAMTEPTVEAKIISLPGDGVTSPEYAYLTNKEVR